MPTSRTPTKEMSPQSYDKSCQSCASASQGRLLALGLAQEGYLNRCPMASYYVLAVAGPLVKDESCPNLSSPGQMAYHVLASASPLAWDEGCPTRTTRSLSTPGAGRRSVQFLDPLATLGHATSAPAPTSSPRQTLTTPGSESAAYCLPAVLRSSTTFSMGSMGSNSSVTRLSHRGALHVPLVLVQEPRERSR